MNKPFRLQACSLLGILFVLTASTSQAQFIFTTTNGAVTLTRYTGLGGDVLVPNSVDGYPVTSIGDSAFAGCLDLYTVTIPESVTSIGDSAFYLCDGLNSVTLGSGVTNIGHHAFSHCYQLTSFAMPDSVATIGDYAFAWSALGSITISNRFASIGRCAFSDCSELMYVQVDPAHPLYATVGGVLFNKDMTRLIQYPAGVVGPYVVPDGVVVIEDSAFSSGRGLESLEMPHSVSNIGEFAFYFCEGLQSVLIGNNVTNIGRYAFSSCSELTSVTLPNSVTRIGDQAFSWGRVLTNVTIGSGVTSIGDAAFSDCPVLMHITVDAANASYADQTGVLFDKRMSTLIQCPRGMAGSYSIPDTVTGILPFAFHSCARLTCVTIPDRVASIGQYAFAYCYGLTNVSLGKSVTSIGDGAFSDCSGLTSVTIPNSLTSLGRRTFDWCSSLTEAYFQGDAPSVPDGEHVFYVESGSVYFLPGTIGWTGNFAGWPTKLWHQAQPQILGPANSLSGSGKTFSFTVSWATNTEVVVEVSTNAQAWIPVFTNGLIEGSFKFEDPACTNYAQRFYRARSQ